LINFSLEKLRSSDATEIFRVKKGDNVLTKSRKLEIKSSWVIKLRSSLALEKTKDPRLADSISPYYLFTDRAALVSCNYDLQCVHSLSHETHGRSGAPNGRGPRFLEPAEPAIATPLPVFEKMHLLITCMYVCVLVDVCSTKRRPPEGDNYVLTEKHRLF